MIGGVGLNNSLIVSKTRSERSAELVRGIAVELCNRECGLIGLSRSTVAYILALPKSLSLL